MLQLTGIKNAALRAAVKPRQQDSSQQQPDFTQYIPNYRLKGRKMRTSSLSDGLQPVPNERIIKLREYKTKHNNLWQVEQYLAKDTPSLLSKHLSNVNNDPPISAVKPPSKFTSANLPNKMNDYLNQLVLGYGTTIKDPSPSRNSESRTSSSQNMRQAIHKKKQESNCSVFFKVMRRAVNRTYRKSELYQNHTMPLLETNYVQKMKDANDMVRRASRLPQRETKPVELKLVDKGSPKKCYRKKSKSREQVSRNSSAYAD